MINNCPECLYSWLDIEHYPCCNCHDNSEFMPKLEEESEEDEEDN